jgi:hypothetical protein
MRVVCRFLFWVAPLALASSAFAGSFSFSGNFLFDNDLQKFTFTIANPGIVTMQTWSFAGGTNANATVIPVGGFAPVLALFDSTQTIVGNFDQGGVAPNNCGPRHQDPPGTGACLDAFLSDSLGAGTYTLVLSQQDNIPLGQTLADGYQHDGEPNFANGFNDFGLQRNSAWAVDIVSVDSASPIGTTATPEPSTALVLFAGLVGLAGMSLKRKVRG